MVPTSSASRSVPSDSENLRPSPLPGSLGRMHVPPGVEILVDEVFGEEGEVSPGVPLRELLTAMPENGIRLAAIIPLSPIHIIVISYRDPAATNAKTPPGQSQGARKR